MITYMYNKYDIMKINNNIIKNYSIKYYFN